jgi:hypothetical protein
MDDSPTSDDVGDMADVSIPLGDSEVPGDSGRFLTPRMLRIHAKSRLEKVDPAAVRDFFAWEPSENVA